ncbi:MAG: HAD-IIIC family phosphatase [Clostridia bacterium]|nr:HAD-IIIC family phosphatase [Clostridia bacterium]
MVVFFLNFDALYPNAINEMLSKRLEVEDIATDALTRYRTLLSSVKTATNAKIIWFGFEDYGYDTDIVCGHVPVLDGIVDRVNGLIKEELSGEDVYLDLKSMIAENGISKAYSRKNKHRWGVPYSQEFVTQIAVELDKQYSIHHGKTKKCLVLDCDNVLWGGILSEDKIGGINLGSSGTGREFQDFQRFLVTLYYHGVILAVCSKNDEADVLRVFREHSGMLLREEHIACFLCNWRDKPHNIRAIADKLNIGTESMVFVDDSPFEIEGVKALLPEVEAVLYDRDSVFEGLRCFCLRSGGNNAPSSHRTEIYKTNEKREALRVSCSSLEEYIASLHMKLDIHVGKESELGRLSELTQRTNRCTNGKRYTREQLRDKLCASPYKLYSVSLSDRFSDFGIVGVIGLCEKNVDLFSLSCRALGRKIEDDMIGFSKANGAESISFFATSKNAALCEMLEAYGLTVNAFV